MPRNYYADLEVNVDASSEEIAQAYRRLALRYHPKFRSMDEVTTMHHFSLISEAFQVLNDPMRRAFYDKYGEEQLKQGFFHKGGKIPLIPPKYDSSLYLSHGLGGYRYQNNPLEIFEEFFLAHNPFAEIVDLTGEQAPGTMFGYQFQAQNYELTHPPKSVNLEIECSLEELYNGCSKIAQYYRRVLNQDGRTTRSILTEKMVQIKQGIAEGTQIVFPREGDQAPRFDNSDLIITIREVEHNRFRRLGNDLVFTQQVNLADSWSLTSVEVITLDSRVLRVPVDEVVTPNLRRVVEGEGMPIPFESLKGLKNKDLLKPYKSKGNLIITFDVVFPQSLGQEELQRLSEILVNQ